MKKRILSTLVTLALCLGLLLAGAWAAPAPAEETVSRQQEQVETQAEGETQLEEKTESSDPAKLAAWAELTSRITVQAAPALAAAANGGVTGAITRSAGGTTVTVIRDSATFTTLNVEFRAWTDASLPAVAFTPTVNGLDGAQFNVGSTPVSLLNLASGFGMNVVQDSDGVTYTFDFAAWEDRYGADPIDTLTYDDVESSGGTIYLFYRQNGEETDSGLVDVHLSLGGYPGDTQVPVTGTGKLVAGPINDTSALDALRRSDVAIPEGTTWGYHSAALRPKTGSGSLSVTSVRLVYGGLYYQVDSDMSSADSVLLPVSEYDLWIYYQRAYLLNVTIEGFDNKLGNTVNGSPLADNTYIFSVPENGFLDFSVGIASDSNAVVTNTTTDEVLFDSDRDGYEVKRFNYQFSGDRMQGGQSVTVEFKSVSTYLLEYSHYVDNPGVNQSYHGFSVMLNGTALSRDQRTIGIKKGDVLKFNSGGSNMTESYMVNTIVLNGTALNLPDFSWTRPASSGANVTTERNNVVLFDSAQNKMATVNITTRVNYAGSGNSSYPSQANNPNGTYTEVEFVEIYNNIKMNRANLAPKAYPDLIFYEIDEGLSGRIHNYNQSELIPGAAIYPMQASGENPSLVLDVEFGYYVTQLRMGDSDSISPQAGSTWYGDKNYYANNGGGPLAQQNYDKIMANPTNRGYLESELINFQFAYHNDLSNDSLNVQDGMAFTLPLDSTGQATNSSVVLAGDAGGATLLGWKLGINGSTVYYPGQTIPRADIVARQGGCVTYENTAGQATIHLYPVTTTTTGVGAPTMAQVTFHWGSSTHSINIAGLLEGSYLDRDTVMSISEVQNAIQGFVPDGYVLDPVISTSMLKLSAGGVSNNQFHLYFVVPSVLITFDSDYGFDVSGSNVMNTQYRHQQPGGAFSNLPIPWDDDTDNVVFVGWSTNQYATTGEDLTSATVPEADTIYYAVYVADLNNDDTPDRDEAQYSITFWAGTTESAITRQFPFAESGGSYEGLYKNLLANQLVNAQTTGFGVNFLVSTPNGYQFAGWEVNPTNGGDGNPIPTEWLPGPISGGPHGNLETSLPSTAPYATEVEFIMPASNVDFTAKWNVQITFESENGFSSGTANGGYQTPGEPLTSVPTPADTSNDGVVFTNWVRSTTMSGNTTTTELTDDLTGETVPDGPTTYVAQYVTDSNNDGVPDGDQVTITFESNYGFEDENGNQVDGPISTLQTPGQTLVLPTPWDAEDDDVVFTGWSPDVVVGTTEVPTSAATYTAVYEDDLNNDGTPDDTQEKYTVTFDPGIAGIFASMPSNQTDLVAGQPMTVTSERPSSAMGYHFTGWSVEPNTLPTTANESYTMPAQNVVFTALWDVDIYFESDHGFEDNNHIGWLTIQTPGDLLEALTPIDTNSDGVVFIGWERETTTPSGVITTELSTDLSNELVPDGPSTYTAIYVTDANNDGFPDDQQVRITFEVVLASGAAVRNPGFQEWNYGTEQVNEGATQIISLQKPGEVLVVPHAVETANDNLAIVGWDPAITEGTTTVPSSPTTYTLTLGPDLNNDGTPDDQENHYSITFDPGIADFSDEASGGYWFPFEYTALVGGQPIDDSFPSWDMHCPDGYILTGWTVTPTDDYYGDPIPTEFWLAHVGAPGTGEHVPSPFPPTWEDGSEIAFYMPASDVVFTAQWDVEITFTSAYGLNGDEASTSISSYQTPGETMAGIPTPVDTDSDGVVFTGWQPSVSTGDVVPTAPTTYTAQYADDLNNDGVADEAQVTITFVSEHGFVNAGASMQRIDTLQSPGGPLNIADTPLDTDSDGVVFVGWNTDQNATTGTSLSGESVPSTDTTYYAIYKDDTNNDGTEDERQVTVTFTITGNPNGFQAFTHGGQSWAEGVKTIDTLQTPGETLAHPNGVQSSGDDIAEIGWNPPLDATVPAGGGSYTLEYGADLNNDNTPDDQESDHYSITFDPGIVDGVSGFDWHMMGHGSGIPNSNTVVTPDIFSDLVAGQPVDFGTFNVDTYMIVPDGYQFTGWTVTPVNGYDDEPIPTDWWPTATIDTSGSNLIPSGAMYIYDVYFVMPGDDVVFIAQWDVEVTFKSEHGFDGDANTSISSYQSPNEALDNIPDPLDTNNDGVVFTHWVREDTSGSTTLTDDLTGETVLEEPVTYVAQYADDVNNDGEPDGNQVTITFYSEYGFNVEGSQDDGPIETLQTPNQTLVFPTPWETADDDVVFVGWSTDENATTGEPMTGAMVPMTSETYYAIYADDLNNDDRPDEDEEHYSITFNPGIADGVSTFEWIMGNSATNTDSIPDSASNLVAGQPVNSDVFLGDYHISAPDGYRFTGWTVTPVDDYTGASIPTIWIPGGGVSGGGGTSLPAGTLTHADISFTMPGDDVVFTAQWDVEVTFKSEHGFDGDANTSISSYQSPNEALDNIPDPLDTNNDGVVFTHWVREDTSGSTTLTDDLTGETVLEGPVTYVAQYADDINNDDEPDGNQVTITFYSEHGFETTGASRKQIDTLQTPGDPLNIADIPRDTDSDGVVFVGWNTNQSATTGTDLDGAEVPNANTIYYAIYVADTNNDGEPDGNQATVTFIITGNTNGFQGFTNGSQTWPAGVMEITTLQTPGETLEYPNGVESTDDNIVRIGWDPELDAIVPTGGGRYTLKYGPDLNNNDILDGSENFSITYEAGSVGTAANLPNAVTVAAGSSQTVTDNVPTAEDWLFIGWSVMPDEDYAGNSMPTGTGENFTMPLSNVTFTAQWTADENNDGVADSEQVTITFRIEGNTKGFAEFTHADQTWPDGTTADIVTRQTPGAALIYPQGVETPDDNIASEGWNPPLPANVPGTNTMYTLTYSADVNNDNTPDSEETKYTITYEAGFAGASATNLPDSEANLVAGQSVTVSIQEPTAMGYEFTGWSVNVNGVPTTPGESFSMPNENVVFTAQWGVQITFESDNGFSDAMGNIVDGGFQVPGAILADIPMPLDTDDDNVVFTGWSPAINVGKTQVPNEATTYVAQYAADENNNGTPDLEERKFAVIYAEGSVPASVTGLPTTVTDVLVNSTQQVSDVVPTATGYVFDGWSVYPSTDYAGDLMPTEGGESFQMPQCNVTFTAQWAQDTNGDGVPDREQVEITFTISGNPAGFDAFSHGSQHWSAGQTTIVTLQQAGQTLVAPDGVESANDGIAEVGWEPVLPDTVPSSDAAYTLVYEEDRNNNNKPDSEEETYTITYDAGVAGSNVSNLPVSQTDVLSGTTQQVSTQQPTATGYRFTGWSVDPDAVPTTGGARYTMPAQNVTFTAKWDVQITFTSAYGFEGIGGYSYDGGYQTPGQPLANVPTPRDTETDKVTFTGWQPVIEIGVVVPEGPTVYIAQYADDKNNDGIPDSSQVTITFYSQRGFTTAGGATKEIVTVQELGGVLNIPDTPLDTPVDKVVFVGWSTDANAEAGSIPTRVPEGDTTYYAIYLPDLDGDGRPDGEEELYNIIYDAGIVGSNAIGMPSNATDVPGNTMQLVDTKEPSANGYLFEGWTVTPSQDYSGYSMPTTGGSTFLMPAENVTFTAQWEQDANGDGIPDSEQVEITFTITGNPAGFAAFTNGTQSWDVGEISIVTVQEAGQPLASPVGVESAGDNIALVGWNPSLPSTVPSRDASYTLVYSPDKNNDDKPDSEESKYTITYEAGVAASASGLTGMPAGRSDLVAGQTVTVDGAIPTATGYQFIGWSVNVSSVPTTAGASFTMPSQNVVFTAQWRVGITFTSDHGFEEGSSPYGPIYLTAGEILTGIPTPRDTDDDNVVFTGWSPAIEEGMTVVPNGATTYEAQYVADTNNDGRPDGTETTYTITYSSGIAGITATMPSDVPGQLAGSPQTVPITEPSASGYIFQGWTVFPQRDYDGNPIPTTSGDTYRMPEQDVIFTALWSEDANNDGTPDDQQVKITFTITGNPNGFQAFAFGGSAAGETQIVTVQTIGQPLASPEGRESNNDGIALVGWNPSLPSTVPGNDAAYELVYGADANNNDTPDHQEGTYSITYEAGAATNAAGLPEPETGLLAGSNQNVASSTPTAAGWIFDGWQVNVAGLPTNSGDPFTMPRENVVFTAQWQVDSNGDGTPDSQQVEITFISPVGLTDSMGAYVSGPIVTLQTPGSTLQVPTVWETPEDGVTTHGWDTDPAATMGSSLTGVNVSSTATTYYAIVTYDPQVTQLTQTGTATVTSSDGYRIGQDYSADISSWFTDEDTANLTYGLTPTSGSGSAVLTGTILTYTPDAADVDQVVTLEVTASDGSATATVTVEIIVSREADQSSSKQIIYFVIDGQTGQSIIDHVAGTVEVLMPIGTDLSRLEPIVTHSGVEITPSTGIIQDFTQPVVYTVRAEDGSIKTYTVTVRIMEYVNQLLDVTLPDSVISLSQAYSRASIVANQALPQTTLAQMNEGSFNIQLSWKLKEGERFTNAPGGTNTYVWTAVVPDQMMVAPGVVITGEVMVRNDYTADWSMASGMAQSALLSVQDFVRKEG